MLQVLKFSVEAFPSLKETSGYRPVATRALGPKYFACFSLVAYPASVAERLTLDLSPLGYAAYQRLRGTTRHRQAFTAGRSISSITTGRKYHRSASLASFLQLENKQIIHGM
jgi:hypothetical protein